MGRGRDGRDQGSTELEGRAGARLARVLAGMYSVLRIEGKSTDDDWHTGPKDGGRVWVEQVESIRSEAHRVAA